MFVSTPVLISPIPSTKIVTELRTHFIFRLVQSSVPCVSLGSSRQVVTLLYFATALLLSLLSTRSLRSLRSLRSSGVAASVGAGARKTAEASGRGAGDSRSVSMVPIDAMCTFIHSTYLNLRMFHAIAFQRFARVDRC